MRTLSLEAVTVATVLPFHPDGAIDWPSFQRLLAYAAAPASTRAVFVNGHAGESACLSAEERTRVIHFAREQLRPGQQLVAGLVANSTEEAVAQARLARAAGADALTVFPLPAPHASGPLGQQQAVAHVRAIGEAVDLPLALFQYPVGSGASYSTATLVALAALPWVVAIKEGSDSMSLYEDNWRALKAAAPGVAILPSNFDWFLPQLAVGGDGILSGLACLAPQPLAELWEASERQDLVAMRVCSAALYPLVRAIYALPRSLMYARIKLGLHLLGVIDSAHSRALHNAFEPEVAATLCAAMTHAGLGLAPSPQQDNQ